MISAPNLEILNLESSVSNPQAHRDIASFLERCGSALVKLYVDACHYPPITFTNIEPIFLPNVRVLFHDFPTCTAPALDINAPALEHLTLQYYQDLDITDDLDNSNILVAPYVCRIRTLTVLDLSPELFHMLWAFSNVETLRLQIDGSEWRDTEYPEHLAELYESLLVDGLGESKDITGSFHCPQLQHLHLRLGVSYPLSLTENGVSLFNALKAMITARLDVDGVHGITHVTFDFYVPEEGTEFQANISHAQCTRQNIFAPTWLTEQDWAWFAHSVPNFSCNLLNSLGALGSW